MRHEGKPSLDALSAHDHESGMGSDAGAIVQAGGTMMQTRTQFTGAIQVQQKRNRERLLAESKEEARLCGADFYYRWTVKDKNSSTGESIIEGISIDGAMILARNFGNCGVPIEIVQDAPKHWIMSATFVDFETGFNVTRLFRQRKANATSMNTNADRQQDIAFQIGQSKAQRNVIVKAMPVWLLKQCFDEAEKVEIKKYQNVDMHRPRFIESYAKGGVSQEQLEKKLNRKAEAWRPEDIAILAAIARGIKDGSTSLDNEFPKGEPEAPKSKPEATDADFQELGDNSDLPDFDGAAGSPPEADQPPANDEPPKGSKKKGAKKAPAAAQDTPEHDPETGEVKTEEPMREPGED